MSYQMLPSANISIAGAHDAAGRAGEQRIDPVERDRGFPEPQEQPDIDDRAEQRVLAARCQNRSWLSPRPAAARGCVSVRRCLTPLETGSRRSMRSGHAAVIMPVRAASSSISRQMRCSSCDERRLMLEIERAGGRQVDLDDLLDARRPGREHDDAVGQEHRLVDLVGDEQRGRSWRAPRSSAAPPA